MEKIDIKSIVKEVNEKIFDETFVKKYGTSVSFNMGLEYEDILTKNFVQLQDQFKKIDKDYNSYIDKNELFEFLTKLNQETGRGNKLQKNSIDDLFKFLDSDSDNKITM
jgi:Ca2+-binding EF-hand superfamily protein